MSEDGKGILYLVATPIGNLEDITLRALRVLKEVDLIACEDTRHTIKLLNHYDIKKPLESYHEHNKITKGNYLIEQLKTGANIAMVSDAGTPGISDPGQDLVRLCQENDVKVTMCPGPVAAVTGLVLSGQDTGQFVFQGFIPVNKRSRKKHLDAIKDETRTIILHEAPHKLKYTLNDLYETLGDRSISLARELTKHFEEVKKGTISDFIKEYETRTPKGEYVLIIKGKDEAEEEQDLVDKYADISIVEHVNLFIADGITKKDAVVKVAKLRGIKKSDVYNTYEAELDNRNS